MYSVKAHVLSAGRCALVQKQLFCRGFFIFLLTCLSLLWNMVAVIIACIIGPVRNIAATIILAIIYFIVGVPGAWVTWCGDFRVYLALPSVKLQGGRHASLSICTKADCGAIAVPLCSCCVAKPCQGMHRPSIWQTACFRYQRLYKGMISDGAVSFATFFCFFMIHIAFAIWSAIAPSIGDLKAGAAHTGFLPAIDFVKGSGGGDKLAGAALSLFTHVTADTAHSLPRLR